jgi:predicted transcriptional regulator YdeE/DNA-binding transcriptional MerR regulator
VHKIGDFSRLAHVTVKTLRHYAKVGLLKPVWIDRFTGYRYYSLQQLSRLNRIIALKDLGFTLEQIRPMLDGSLPVDRLRAILKRKQEELAQQLQDEQTRLAQVEERLRQIEMEANEPAYEVVLKKVNGKNVASVLHCGDSSNLLLAHAALLDWIGDHAYQADSPIFEAYLDDQNSDGSACRMIEVQVVVERLRPRHASQSEHQESEDKDMEIKIVERPAFSVMGVKYEGKNEHDEIGKAWDQFNAIVKTRPELAGPEAYGVCNWVDESSGVFEYVCAFGVKNIDQMPEEFVLRTVPAHRYAVFAHHGSLDTLRETYNNIYRIWLPQSGLKLHPDKFDMEIYDEGFKIGAADSIMWIYVAVE